jgi:glyoxylate/hydroxypyruvate reductase
MKIFVYATLEKDLQDDFRNQIPEGFQVFFKSEIEPDQQRLVFEDAQILMGNPPPEWMEKIPNLIFWQLDSAGFDKYSHLKLGIPVANMGAFFAQACAETMVAGILALYRHLPELILSRKDHRWIRDEIRLRVDLLGSKEVIILGAGNIGKSLKQILEGFGCSVKFSARTNPVADFHSIEEVYKALPKADVVINTLPGAAENYVTSAFFDAMKKGSIYASVGRGSTTDEDALIFALKSNRLAGAVLDVTKDEPLHNDNPLWGLDNVILTQHTGGGREGENSGKVKEFLSNLNKFLEGKQIENLVDLSKGY